MQKNVLIGLFVGAVVVVGAIFLLNKRSSEPVSKSFVNDSSITDDTSEGDISSTMPTVEENNTPEMQVGEVKEFSMNSWYDVATKTAHFSLGQMVVSQGDMVRVKVTNTFGNHDFTIDEYGIKKQTPQDETTVIEFTADKVGDFVYYCSIPGHRAAGQWGTLKVLAN